MGIFKRKKEFTTSISKGSRSTLLQVVRTLSEQRVILQKMAADGMCLYDSIPPELKNNERFDNLDCSNSILEEASLDLALVVNNIKSIME